ncbi:MAG: hypothetical protein HY858_16230, partial [Candidatus Solibacter usitatus]|nr:hypothetical protein [Candidatus Solibacter usitatus]
MRGLLLLLAAAVACIPLRAQLVLDRYSTLVVSSREPESLRKAAADLAADLERVFGARPPMAETAPARGPAIVVALRHNLPAGLRPPEQPETPLLQAAGGNLILTGSDPRGAIYAVYEFSHRHLGVDPLHWWTDHEPEKKKRISLPSGYRFSPGPPICANLIGQGGEGAELFAGCAVEGHRTGDDASVDGREPGGQEAIGPG